MKSLPFFISTATSAVALVLAVFSYTKGNSNLDLQKTLQEKQQKLQVLREGYEELQRQAQTQQQTIEAGATVVQKYGRPIIGDLGFLAAKNKNENIKKLLVRQHLEGFILTDEQVKQVEEQAKRQQTQQGNSAPATPAPATNTPR